jgi:hypothetical protein
MLEGKTTWVLGGILVGLGSVLLFLTYLTSMVGFCGDPAPGCHSLVNVKLGILAMSVLAAGLGFMTMGAHGRMRESLEMRVRFMSIASFFILSLIILSTVFNPLISPYDTIRDSDLDGYTDNIDSYPHDQARHFPPFFELIVEWENTTTNYSFTVTDIYDYMLIDPGPLSRVVLTIRWYSESYFAYSEDVATLEELDGAWIGGTMFMDRGPLGELSVNDSFTFDTTIYHVAFEVYLSDDAGHMIAMLRDL